MKIFTLYSMPVIFNSSDFEERLKYTFLHFVKLDKYGLWRYLLSQSLLYVAGSKSSR